MYGAGAAWSRLFLPGARADPSRSEPELAPGPWLSGAGAAQKSGGSATLVFSSENCHEKVIKISSCLPDAVLWIRIRLDPELLSGSGSGTRKIQSWIWIIPDPQFPNILK